MLVAGGCGSIFNVWLNMGTFRGHSMHTTSCMYLSCGRLASEHDATEIDLLRCLAAWHNVHGVSA
jgi:hypothetical protein